MKHFAAVIALAIAPLGLILFTGCKPDKPLNESEKGTLNTVMEKDYITPDVMDIGDVEAKVSIRTTVAPESRKSGVKVEEMTTPNGLLNYSTAEVYPPYPDKLMCNVLVKSDRNFESRPVAMRATLYRGEGEEREAIGHFDLVLGAHAMRQAYRDADKYPPFEFTFDVLSGLKEIPDSILVYVDADVVLMPENTDETTLDPNTATASKEDTSVISSNPLRINFIQEKKDS